MRTRQGRPSGFDGYIAVSKEWFNLVHRSVKLGHKAFRQRSLKLVLCGKQESWSQEFYTLIRRDVKL